MKCPNCGGQMGLEDVACPYCDTPNAMAAQHQSDMAHFREEYERTQDEVLENTSGMRRHGSWLVVVTILLVGLVIGIILQASAWDIGHAIREHNVEQDAAADKQMLDTYLEQGDYGKFVGYYDSNDIYLSSYESYQAVHSAARAYVDIMQLVDTANRPEELSYTPEHLTHVCEYLADDLNDIFTLEKQYSYALERYLPDSMRPYVEDIRERAGVIAQTYLGLTEEQVKEIPDMSEQKLARLIEGGITS